MATPVREAATQHGVTVSALIVSAVTEYLVNV
jgi:hypothetical protein